MDGPKMEQGPTLTEQLEHWKGIKEIIKERLDLYESGTVANSIGSDAAEIPKMQAYEEALTDIASLCERIRNASDKTAEIKNMVEILVQKDPEWLEKDAGNDLRIAFFMEYFYMSHPGYENRHQVGIHHLSPAEILEELRNKRFDPTFFADVESKLDDIEKMFAAFSKDNRATMKWLGKMDAKANRMEGKSTTRLREQLAEAEAHIARIENLLSK